MRCRQGYMNSSYMASWMSARDGQVQAGLALVEGVKDEPFDGLVEERVVLGRYVGEEDVRRLAAQLGRRGNEVLCGVLHDRPSGRRLAREGDLGDPVVGRQRLADLRARAVDDVDHAGREDILDQLGELENRPRSRARRLEQGAVGRGDRRRHLPGRHQQREVGRDDLADDAERRLDVVGVVSLSISDVDALLTR
jgi:hypothetical protein